MEDTIINETAIPSIENEANPEPMKINPKRRVFFYSGLAVVFGLLITVVWFNIVGLQVRSQLVNCPTNITSNIQQSAQAYLYGMNPGNWGDLGIYENQLCKNILANATLDGIPIGSTTTVNAT